MDQPSFWYGWLVGGLIGGLIGYAVGGFVATVVLVIAGVEWLAVAMFGIVGIMASLACLWMWRRRSLMAGEG